ncbi:MAG: hypothetical protein Q7S58_09265, partial [Candidatus Binatus sp.]|uniref:hypothetical protein n=1 Tax=Candidatus Binatus sp. TaxID=2811406 RepID=UPI00271C56DF
MASIETKPLEGSSLGPEVEVRREEIDGAMTPARRRLSHERLARPVHVVTAEHLGWYAIAIWAVATRLIALGARPLDPAPARIAMLEYALAKDGLVAVFEHPGVHASWPEIMQAWIFAALGATDFTSRIVLAVCALILIGAAAAMRPYLGRAGAMGFAGLLAISPSVAYFSRGGSSVICSMAFMMASVALAFSLKRHRSPVRAFVLGIAIALWLSGDPIGYATLAAAIVALAFIGLFDLVTVDHRRLRFRIWWEQRRALVLTTTFVAIFAWVWLTTGVMTHSLSAAIPRDVYAAFKIDAAGFERSLRMLAPILGFYEYLIAMLAIVGLIAIVTRGITGAIARWSIIWAIVSVGIFLTVGATGPDAIVAMVIPLAMVAGCGLEWMHDSIRWEAIRIPIAIAAALTIYLQVMTNFVYATPDVSEKPWDRHALLFWTAPTTTIETRRECARAASSVTAEASAAMIPAEAPQVAWYLRKFAPTDSRDAANIVVTIPEKTSSAAVGSASPAQFGFEESWTPAYDKMRAMDAIQYLFTQRVWNEVQIRDLELVVRRPSGPP